jgi:hypothetical protein
MTATERPDAPRPAGEQHDEDAAQLAALGYRSEFNREMSLRANFALDNWIVVLSTVVVVAVGLLYMIGARPWEKSTAAAGDAVRGGA